MVQSIGSNSNYWYQQTRNQVKDKTGSDSTVTASTLVSEDEKAARSSNLSLMDIMGLMQNSNTAKQKESKEDATDGDISALDADGDGTLSADEYDSLISQLGINNAQSAEDFFKEYDTDGDGEITSEEMQAKDTGKMMPPPPPPIEEEDTDEVGFSSGTDTDGDGKISAAEYEAFVSNNGLTDALSAEDFFDLYDTDEDGQISTDEVKAGAEKANIQNLPPMGPPPETGFPSEIDTDGDGTLSTDEYENLVSSLGLEDAPAAKDFFSQYDTNDDGEISADEASAVLNMSTNYRMQAMNAYENNYLYLDDEEDSEVDSIA